MRCRTHLDETIFVRPKRPVFTDFACFASTDEVSHDMTLTLHIHIVNDAPHLPNSDVATSRVRQNQRSDKLAAASHHGLNITDIGDDACYVDAERWCNSSSNVNVLMPVMLLRKLGDPDDAGVRTSLALTMVNCVPKAASTVSTSSE